MADSHLLVIEDEGAIAIDIESALTVAGYTNIALAATEKHALARIEGEAWDAVIADANLNGKGIQHIVEALDRKRIPFVIVTGYERENLPEILRSAPLIAKPFTGPKLLQIISELLMPAHGGDGL
ncbi:MAG TPA: response regulator [Bryobacteraceae bacterium]|jgi:CheY-like chemotaxis protein